MLCPLQNPIIKVAIDALPQIDVYCTFAVGKKKWGKNTSMHALYLLHAKRHLVRLNDT